MSPPDYTALDAAILERLANGSEPPTFTQIVTSPRVAALISDLAKRHNAGRPPYTHKSEDRFVDARLQALRRAGKAKFSRGGWLALQEPPVGRSK